MLAQDKDQFITELKQLLNSLTADVLLSDPDNVEQNKILNRAIAIFKSFSHDIGVELDEKKKEFQKWCRAGERPKHSKNLLNEIIQFVDQKIQEMDVYVIEPKVVAESQSTTKDFIRAEQPKTIGNVYWWLEAFKLKSFFNVKKDGKIRKLKLFFVILTLLILSLVVLKFYFLFFTVQSSFRYEMFGKSYQSRETNIPTVIDGWLEGKVKNISSERRFLDRLHYVLWRDEKLSRVWDYGYGVGKVYEIIGEERKEVSLPILFEPNESKQLAWDIEIDVSDQEIYNAYTERTGKGIFTWTKRDIDLQFEDTRGNIFDEEGRLISQSVIDAWWVLPNNRTVFQKITAYSDLSFKILAWEVRRFLHLTL